MQRILFCEGEDSVNQLGLARVSSRVIQSLNQFTTHHFHIRLIGHAVEQIHSLQQNPLS